MVREFPMKLYPGGRNSINRVLFRGKPFREHPYSVVFDVSHPLPPGSVPRHTLYSRCIVLFQFHVAKVLRGSGRAEIQYGVVRGVPVNVVDPERGKVSVNIQPRKPVTEVQKPVHEDLNIPMSIRPKITRTTTGPPGVPCFFLCGIRFPSEYTSRRIVVKEFLQAGLSSAISWCSHKSKGEGQRREVETATGLLRGVPQSLLA